MLTREVAQADDIRVEFVLKGAQSMYMRKHPGVAEIYSQPRVCQEASTQRFGDVILRPGWSLDLTTKDPVTGRPWNLADKQIQARVKKLVRDTEPFCIVGSPPCTAFSPLQELSRAKRDPRVMQRELREARVHIQFCLEVYEMQLRAKRHFVHEHPRGSKAWQLPEMLRFLMMPGVECTELNMCAFGMTSRDEKGIGLVKKDTRIMSSAPEVLKRVHRKCCGGHRHVHLISGRARAAQVYPREFCHKLCEGIAAQKKLDDLGMTARPVLSMEEMDSVATGRDKSESPL